MKDSEERFNIYDGMCTFLCAAPSFAGPIFEESVVMILEDNEDGTLGVIINNPTGEVLADLKPEFDGERLGDCEVFYGGPVGKNILSLGGCHHDKSGNVEFSFGLDIEKTREILKTKADIEIGAFVGYASWGPGQLREEIDEGIWIVSRANPNEILLTPPERQWTEMLLEEFPEFKNIEPPTKSADLN